jgi:hypothetical protein
MTEQQALMIRQVNAQFARELAATPPGVRWFPRTRWLPKEPEYEASAQYRRAKKAVRAATSRRCEPHRKLPVRPTS